ncbi:hypothetical protein OsI_06545 [Oryza sativa Indica Group]|uniref:Uncharacterized protein n=1 Tax=Oryza sativa subsp. indica TaxID=39946 RepID=B8AEX8_ORYSI|nr:hypothetical protein OsI_06545 [Oryza sativa Indica Group]
MPPVRAKRGNTGGGDRGWGTGSLQCVASRECLRKKGAEELEAFVPHVGVSPLSRDTRSGRTANSVSGEMTQGYPLWMASVSSAEQPPADLEGDVGVDAGVPDLLIGEAEGVPAAHGHPLQLDEVGAHDDVHHGLQAGLYELRAAQPLRREGAKVGGVPRGEAVVVAQPLGVLVHADADEAVRGAGEEAAEGARDVVGMEEREDEAPAVDPERQQRDRVLRDGGGLVAARPPWQGHGLGEVISMDLGGSPSLLLF